MGRRNVSGVRKVVRGQKPAWVLDFPYTDENGKRRRFRRLATVQNFSASLAEAGRLMKQAAETGIVEEEPERSSVEVVTTVTYKIFVETTFEAQFMPNYRPATAERYRALHRQRVLAFFGDKPLDAIGAGDFRSFAADLSKAGIQAKGPITWVRSVLNAAVASGYLDEVPVLPRGLVKTSPKLPDAPSPQDVAVMLTAPGWRGLAIALGAHAGMRMGEVRALEVRDVDLERGVIVVRRALSANVSLTPKNGQERIVPMVPELAARLRVAMKDKLPRARVILDETGKTPARQGVLTRFKAFVKRNGLKERSFHSLRHYFISQLVRCGAGLEAVRLLAGHAKLEMTARYSHATTADLHEAMAKLK